MKTVINSTFENYGKECLLALRGSARGKTTLFSLVGPGAFLAWESSIGYSVFNPPEFTSNTSYVEAYLYLILAVSVW